MLEVAVECEDIAGAELVGERNQTGIGKVRRRVAVFANQSSDSRNIMAEVKWYLQRSFFDAGEYGVDSRVGMAEDVECFSDTGLARDECGIQRPVRFNAAKVRNFTPVVERDEKA